MRTTLKTVGVKELKDNLSLYLREVQLGKRIFVTDRNVIIAELHEPLIAIKLGDSIHPILTEWIDKKIIFLPKHKKRKIGKSPVSNKQGTAQKLLDEDRGE